MAGMRARVHGRCDMKPLPLMTGQELADHMGDIDARALAARSSGTDPEDILLDGDRAVAELNARRFR